MKYKTTIEIVSDAENKAEALEIVGEYLSGNLVTGVDMKCGTRPVTAYKRAVLSVLIITLLISAGVVATSHVKTNQGFINNLSGIGAVQPPLKTSELAAKDKEFKKKWDAKQMDEALNLIKK